MVGPEKLGFVLLVLGIELCWVLCCVTGLCFEICAWGWIVYLGLLFRHPRCFLATFASSLPALPRPRHPRFLSTVSSLSMPRLSRLRFIPALLACFSLWAL
jgi:hypothetical protein